MTAVAAPTPVLVLPRSRAQGLSRFVRRYRSNRLAVLAFAILVLAVAVSLAAPWLAPYAPEQINVTDKLLGPTSEHWLGTDVLGRDTFSRLIYAGRVSLYASCLAVGVAVVLGVPAGLVAGYFGGIVDWVLGRAADVLMTFPSIVLALAIVAATGPGLENVMVALGIVYAPKLFRVVRGAALAVRQETYVEASISIGTPVRSIIFRRVLPNVLSVLLVQTSLLLASALLAEAALSLLGLGVLPPTPSLGNMLGAGFDQIRTTPILVWVPGCMIAVLTLCFNLIGDGLRDSLGRETRKGD